MNGRRFILVLTGALALSTAAWAASDTTVLAPEPLYGKEAKLVAYLLANNHYSKLQLNDSLSSAILDDYLNALDNNKTFFLASDIKSFEKYRDKLDDYTLAENVQPAFDIYNVFRRRFAERMNYVTTKLLNKKFDFTQDEYYETDRSKEPWAASVSDLNDVWRKIIKSQALSLKLSGKSDTATLHVLRTRYDRLIRSVDQFRAEDVYSMFMNSLTDSYDPHTNYFSPRDADYFKQSMSLSLEGIGARLQTENDYTKVIEVLPGGPAEKSNMIHVNDRITGVAQGRDGEMVDVIGWRVDDVVKLIKGPKGTTVRLQILPAETGVAGPPIEISLVRDKINLEDLRATKKVVEMQRDGRTVRLGVITLPSFYLDFDAMQRHDPDYMSTTRDVKNLIEELKGENVDGLVMDLRNNGGGSLSEAIDLTGLFIKQGPVVQVRNSMGQVELGEDTDSSVEYTGPLVVLTNRFSASASEIFAGAIQDYHRGVIVGESTYGKGTVQTLVDLNRYLRDAGGKAGELKVTFQKFYRITGSSTQHQGVTPDIEFPTALNPEQFGESSSPSALPWDEIKGTLYEKTPFVDDKVLRSLTLAYQKRLETDSTLDHFVEVTNENREKIQNTKVSLNEAVRRKEMEESEKLNAGNTRLSATMDPNEVLNQVELPQINDEYLREGLLVLTDLINAKIG